MRRHAILLPLCLLLACDDSGTSPTDDTGTGDDSGDDGGDDGGDDSGDDGGDDGGNVNIKPVVDSVTITPEQPTSAEELTCAAEASDGDGDELTLTFTWTIEGVDGEAGSGETLAAGTAADSIVTCSVVANDGVDDSDPGTASVTILAPDATTLDSERSGIDFGTSGVYDAIAEKYAFAQAMTFSADATITGFGVHFAYGACGSCSFGVYEDDSGAPGSLVGQATGACDTADADANEIEAATSFAVPAGSHWIAAWFDECTLNDEAYISADGTEDETTYYVAHPSSTLPDPAGMSATITEDLWAVWPLGY